MEHWVIETIDFARICSSIALVPYVFIYVEDREDLYRYLATFSALTSINVPICKS